MIMYIHTSTMSMHHHHQVFSLLSVSIPTSFSADSFPPSRYGLLQEDEEEEKEDPPSTTRSVASLVGAIAGAMVVSFGLNAIPSAAASTSSLGLRGLADPQVCISFQNQPQRGWRFGNRHVHRAPPELGRLTPQEVKFVPKKFGSQNCEHMHKHMAVLLGEHTGGHQGEMIGGGSASLDYEQIIQEHESDQMKRGMFTSDAWMGMMRLQRYNELLQGLQEKEKICKECTRNRRLLEQVWQTVSNEYFDQYGRFSQTEWAGDLLQCLEEAGGLLYSKTATYKAAKQLVARLGDQYSSFLTPEEYRFALRRPIQSELKYLVYQYTGVGMEIGKRHPKGGFEIVAPFAGSPAEEAGILGGERLLSVDGYPVDELTPDEAVTLLRGPIGSLVELEIIAQNPEAVPQKFLLERRSLPLPPLKLQMMDAGNGKLVAYIRLHYFTHDGTKRMASAIREGESLGVDGYILDLRNNPGGVFEEAVAMAIARAVISQKQYGVMQLILMILHMWLAIFQIQSFGDILVY